MDEQLVVGTSIHASYVWDLRDESILAKELQGHEGPVVAAQFIDDDQFVVTSSTDDTCRLWDPMTEKTIVAGDGLVMAINRSTGTMMGVADSQVVEFETVRPAVWEYIGSKVQTPEFQLACCDPQQRYLVGANWYGVGVLAWGSWQDLACEQLSNVTSMQVCRDGRTLLLLAGGSLHCWDFDVDLKSLAAPTSYSHESMFTKQVFSPPVGKCFDQLQASNDGCIVRIDDSLYRLDRDSGLEALGIDSGITCIDPTGQMIVTRRSADSPYAKVWDRSASEPIARLSVPEESEGLRFSPSSDYLLMKDSHSISLWRTGGWEKCWSRPWHGGVLKSKQVAFSADDQFVVVTEANELISCFDCESGESLMELREAAGDSWLALSPDATQIFYMGASMSTRCLNLPAVRSRLQGLQLDWPDSFGRMAR